VLIDANVSRKKRKQIADKLSAIIILQGYLDSHGQ
ncbi:MAG: Holliday junction resolvase RuvX, partial [Candidatus Poribacteria bacterium]